MHQLTITIDPTLSAYGPEISWTWRTLLAGIGYAWRELPFGSPADMSYTAGPAESPARLIVRANLERWVNPGAPRLAGLAPGALPHPIYAGEPERPALLSDSDTVRIERDIILDTFWLLTGQEEAHLPRNAHGHLDLAGAPAWTKQALRAAPASAVGATLRTILAGLGLPPPLPPWPYGKSAAAAASHDVDYPEVVRWLEPLRILARQGRAGIGSAAAVALGRRHHWQFAAWMKLERRLGAPSAFYFVPRCGSLPEYALGTPDPFYDVRAPRFRRLLRELDNAGWEIGLHASYRACESPDGIAHERAVLAEAAGVEIAGNRHHYWRLDPQRPEETLLAHERAGLSYDASLAHDRYLGWRRGSSWPFFPFHRGLRRPLRTLQLPTSWMDAHIFLRRAENPGDPTALLRGLADTAAAQSGLLLIDIHDYVYDDALFPGWRLAFEQLWTYINNRGDFWLAPPRAIAAHWAARQMTIERASLGLGR